MPMVSMRADSVAGSKIMTSSGRCTIDSSTRAATMEMSDHDPDLRRVFGFFEPDAARRIGPLIRRATDEVIATARTRRWHLDQCNRQEMAYLGVNIENIIRSEYDLGLGKAGMDFNVNGIDVDCKWSRNLYGW